MKYIYCYWSWPDVSTSINYLPPCRGFPFSFSINIFMAVARMNSPLLYLELTKLSILAEWLLGLALQIARCNRTCYCDISFSRSSCLLNYLPLPCFYGYLKPSTIWINHHRLLSAILLIYCLFFLFTVFTYPFTFTNTNSS